MLPAITASSRLKTAIATTSETNPQRAVAHLIDQLGCTHADALTYFASPDYDFKTVASLLDDAIHAPSIGCTTAGELGADHGYTRGGIIATAITSDELSFEPHLIRDLSTFDTLRAKEEFIDSGRLSNPDFGMLLIDGLSMAEEQVAAALYNILGDKPLVGGSAGDNMRFRETWVAVNGEACRNAAALALVNTTLPYRVFHTHHFEPTDQRLVITRAIPDQRIVIEINGYPAAIGYAKAIGRDVEELNASVFAANPLMLSIGGEYFMRAIQSANDDNSLTLYCAIDEGLVMRIARGNNLTQSIRQQVDAINEQLSSPQIIIAFDCIMRRLESQKNGTLAEAGRAFHSLPVVGFSTYGEQYNGLHVNQTMTGVAIGDAA
ncbi:FIST N-terminal domain-containing protein [Mucisphaera calidilacus]|uniref:FIST N domain protein n=1 Tax=Mucisphaera calidilacus TaxID=2527982 RepID=A0A518BTY1_9BACT|nr:FIST N-terminal domain-containing protein [Mucisphaera calidilacus]QDU70436.1 FIST N domain protein [Mucisphaera calidilacus]